MIGNFYIIFEIIAIALFLIAFFTKQEILWVISLVLFGTLMFTAFNIEEHAYEFNQTTFAYDLTTVSNSYPYFMGLNMVFFVINLILLLFDLFNKYKSGAGIKLGGGLK